MLFYGVIAAGGVYSAASASFTASELSRQVKQGNSNLIFCSEDAKDVAVKTAKECGVPLSRVLVVSSSPEWKMVSLENEVSCLPSKGKLDWERITDQEELDNSLICLLYSSGTTGVPKGSSPENFLLATVHILSRRYPLPLKHCIRVLHSFYHVPRRNRSSSLKRRTTLRIPNPRPPPRLPYRRRPRLLYKPFLHGWSHLLDAEIRFRQIPRI